MRKRSLTVSLTILTIIAAAGCDEQQRELQHCVDGDGVVVDEDKCADAAVSAVAPSDDAGTTHGIGRSGFYWFYGGRSVLSPGTRVSSGSYSPGTGSYSSPSGRSSVGVSRGGFGGSAVSAGGGGE